MKHSYLYIYLYIILSMIRFSHGLETRIAPNTSSSLPARLVLLYYFVHIGYQVHHASNCGKFRRRYNCHYTTAASFKRHVQFFFNPFQPHYNVGESAICRTGRQPSALGYPSCCILMEILEAVLPFAEFCRSARLLTIQRGSRKA